MFLYNVFIYTNTYTKPKPYTAHNTKPKPDTTPNLNPTLHLHQT